MKSWNRVKLDARELAGDHDDRAIISRAFSIVDNCIRISGRGRRLNKDGSLVLAIDRGNARSARATGFFVLCHPTWNTLPKVVLLAGKPLGADHFFWRLFCPQTRTFVPVLYFDPTSELFVSRSAIGRRQRSVGRDIVKQLELQMVLEDLQSKLEKHPTAKHCAWSRLVCETIEDAPFQLRLAMNGLSDLTFDEDGWPDVLAMSKKAGADRRVFHRSECGIIRISTSAKKRLALRKFR